MLIKTSLSYLLVINQIVKELFQNKKGEILLQVKAINLKKCQQKHQIKYLKLLKTLVKKYLKLKIKVQNSRIFFLKIQKQQSKLKLKVI
jgi:hypothetical protein